MTKKRDYRVEYDSYHASPEQIARRAARNKARSTAAKKGLVSKGDGKEVDHLGSNRKGKLGSRTKVVSRTVNRRRQPKRDGSQD